MRPFLVLLFIAAAALIYYTRTPALAETGDTRALLCYHAIATGYAPRCI